MMNECEAEAELVSLRAEIARAGILYRDLAARAGVSVRTISYLMNSDTHDPRMSTLRAVRAALAAFRGQSQSDG